MSQEENKPLCPDTALDFDELVAAYEESKSAEQTAAAIDLQAFERQRQTRLEDRGNTWMYVFKRVCQQVLGFFCILILCLVVWFSTFNRFFF